MAILARLESEASLEIDYNAEDSTAKSKPVEGQISDISTSTLEEDEESDLKIEIVVHPIDPIVNQVNFLTRSMQKAILRPSKTSVGVATRLGAILAQTQHYGIEPVFTLRQIFQSCPIPSSIDSFAQIIEEVQASHSNLSDALVRSNHAEIQQSLSNLQQTCTSASTLNRSLQEFLCFTEFANVKCSWPEIAPLDESSSSEGLFRHWGGIFDDWSQHVYFALESIHFELQEFATAFDFFRPSTSYPVPYSRSITQALSQLKHCLRRSVKNIQQMQQELQSAEEEIVLQHRLNETIQDCTSQIGEFSSWINILIQQTLDHQAQWQLQEQVLDQIDRRLSHLTQINYRALVDVSKVWKQVYVRHERLSALIRQSTELYLLARDEHALWPFIQLESEMLCPITKERMEEPVIAADGYTYERQAITKWLQMNQRSPMTGLPLDSVLLIPNHSLKKLIKLVDLPEKV